MRISVESVLLLSLPVSSVSAFATTSNHRSTVLNSVVPGADIEQGVGDSQLQTGDGSFFYRGKVNEIDYCIAPADVSLSRAYAQSSTNSDNPTQKSLSLTQSLNNASNRAVRRILLARCWPSEEALNLSLRLAAAAEKQAQEARKASGSTAKCPVPRPLLNLLMRKDTSSGKSVSRGRTSEQYVADQISSFRDLYGSLPGYNDAEAYLESVLSLATSGEESSRAKDVSNTTLFRTFRHGTHLLSLTLNLNLGSGIWYLR